MKRWLKWGCPPLAAAGLLLVALVGTFPAQDKKVEKHDGKSLRDSLKDVINTGAELFNKDGDYAGCYRVYQGGLLSVKPFLPPNLQREVDDSLAAAEKLPDYLKRAFALRKTIDHIRDVAPKLQPPVIVKKADDKKPADKAVTDKAKDTDKQVGPKDKDKKDGAKDKKDGAKDKDKKDSAKDKKDGAKDKAKPPTASLWDRMGKEANVKKVVGDFMKAAAEDPKVNVTRNGKYKLDEDGVARLQQNLVDFVSSVTGGPFKYQGKSMKEVHKGMAITNAEFDAAGGHFKKALEKNGVKAPEVNEMMKLLGSTRKDIVEEKQKPAPKKDAAKDTAKKDDAKKDAAKKDDAKKDKPKADAPKTDAPKKVDGSKDDAKKVEPLKTGPQKVGGEGRISGVVTMDGKPAPKGYVTFVSDENRRYSTIIRADGTYGFKVAIPTGKYRVAIEQAFGEKAPQPDLPVRYRNEATSGLAFDVSAGPTTFNVELKRK